MNQKIWSHLTTGMRNAVRSAAYIFGVWEGIAIISGMAALLGYAPISETSLCKIDVCKWLYRK